MEAVNFMSYIASLCTCGILAFTSTIMFHVLSWWYDRLICGERRHLNEGGCFWSSVFDPSSFYSMPFTSQHQTLRRHIWWGLCSGRLLRPVWDILRCQVVKSDLGRPPTGDMTAVTQRRRAEEFLLCCPWKRRNEKNGPHSQSSTQAALLH